MKLSFLLILAFVFINHAEIREFNDFVRENGISGVKFAAVKPESFIFSGPQPSFTIKVSLTKSNRNISHTEMALFHSSTSQFFGLGDGEWCCTQELYDANKCNSVGSLAMTFPQIQLSSQGSYMRSDKFDIFYWTNKDTDHTFSANEKIRLSLPGMWYFVAANCYQNSTLEHLNGYVKFVNPFGYLSGHLFPRVPVYLSVTTVYFGLCFVWVALMAMYKKNLVRMQYVMFLAIFVGFLQESIWSSAWYIYNHDGIPLYWINIIGALFSTIKLTVIRTLILLVSIGYSILVQTLEITPKLGVILITVIYGTLHGTLEYLVVLKDMDISVSPNIQVGIFIVLAFVNALYSIWITYSLYTNIKALKDKKSFPNRQLKTYSQIAIGLLVAGLAAFICFITEITLSYLEYEETLWSTWWIFMAFWEYFYCFLTAFVSFTWRPNSNNRKFDLRYEFIDESSEEPDSRLSLLSAPPIYKFKKDPPSPSFARATPAKRGNTQSLNDVSL